MTGVTLVGMVEGLEKLVVALVTVVSISGGRLQGCQSVRGIHVLILMHLLIHSGVDTLQILEALMTLVWCIDTALSALTRHMTGKRSYSYLGIDSTLATVHVRCTIPDSLSEEGGLGGERWGGGGRWRT